ncbi:MAG TPA: hypothetical protein VF170_18565 [Planctomycetaceae bacterium]
MAEAVIEGRVTGAEAIVTLTLLGPAGDALNVETVVDTGCTAPLVMPSAVAAELGLPLLMTERAELADGSRVACPVYECRVAWGREIKRVRVTAAGPYSLLGMGLLDGHRLAIDVTEGGRVAIDPLAGLDDSEE